MVFDYFGLGHCARNLLAQLAGGSLKAQARAGLPRTRGKTCNFCASEKSVPFTSHVYHMTCNVNLGAAFTSAARNVIQSAQLLIVHHGAKGRVYVIIGVNSTNYGMVCIIGVCSPDGWELLLHHLLWSGAPSGAAMHTQETSLVTMSLWAFWRKRNPERETRGGSP